MEESWAWRFREEDHQEDQGRVGGDVSRRIVWCLGSMRRLRETERRGEEPSPVLLQEETKDDDKKPEATHVSNGSIMTSVDAKVHLLASTAPVVSKSKEDAVRDRADEISDLVLEFGGAMSAEHGDGIVRGVWAEKMFGKSLVQNFREVKQAFDPNGTMNPGKIFDV